MEAGVCGISGLMDIKTWEIDLRNPNPLERVRVYKDGRRFTKLLKPGEHPLLGLKRKFPHPAYSRGYAKAVSHEYQSILIPLFNPRGYELPDDVLDLAAGLSIHPANFVTYSYEDMASYYQTVAKGVEIVRPELVAELKRFTLRHGLDVIPWGRGWLYSSIPLRQSDSNLEIPMDLPEQPAVSDFRPVDRRQTPALDALTLYLYLTRGWRDEEVRELLKSLICFECSSSKKVYCECDKKGLATCECDLTNSANCPRPVCFGASGGLSVRLTSKINFIKSALNFQGGKRGRPPRTSRWDMDEVRFVLNKHANYGVLQREIRQHYSVG